MKQLVAGAIYQGGHQVNTRTNPVSPEAASAAWRDTIEPELHARLLDARPKLKSYEAHMLKDKAREAVIAAMATSNDPGELLAVALAPLAGLKYVRGSRFTNPGPRRSRADVDWVSGTLAQYLMGDGDGGRPETDTEDVRVLVSMAGMFPQALEGDRGFWAGEVLNGLVARREISHDDASMIADHVMGRPYSDPAHAERHVDARRRAMLDGHGQLNVEPHRRNPPQAKVACDPCRVGAHDVCNSPITQGGLCGCWCHATTQRYAPGAVPVAPRTPRHFLQGKRNPLLAVVGNAPHLAPEQRAAVDGKKKPKSKQQRKANPLLAVVGNPKGKNPLLAKGKQAFKKFHGREPGKFWVFTPPHGWREITRAEAERWQGEVAAALGAVPETHYMVPEEWKSSKGPHYYVHEHPEGGEPLEVKLMSNGLTSKLPTYEGMEVSDWWRDEGDDERERGR